MPWIKPQVCIACGVCLKECPVDAIYWWNAKAKMAPRYIKWVNQNPGHQQ